MKANSREAVFVIGEGTVVALAGGPLSLADMGPRKTRRASNIEFKEGLWHVLLPCGRELWAHEDYDVALAWERDYFNHQLSGGLA